MAKVLDPREGSAPIAGAWRLGRHRALLAVAVAVLGILAVFWQTAASIVAIWSGSNTFTHGFVVIPITLWLVWQRRAALERLHAEPWLPGLFAILLFGAAWVVASLGNVSFGRQFALLFMVESAILAVLGLRIARAIAFPLVFLVFAVPFGEFLVPTLIEWTADFTVAALRISGVPVYREGNHFVIPSGSWSVVDACSGIRYMIASLVVGTLFAMTHFRTASRRAAFVVASILVPVVANWLRAYGIVMIGHLTDNRLAVGVDHLIYGWVFFGFVMLLLFWLGSTWREPDVEGRPQSAALHRSTDLPRAPSARLFTIAVLAVLAAAVWQPLVPRVDAGASGTAIALRELGSVGPWTPGADPISPWKPHFSGAAATLEQTFADASGRRAALHVSFYRNQTKGRELVTSAHGLVDLSNWEWKQLRSTRESVEWMGVAPVAQRALIAGQGGRLLVYKLYWIDGYVTASDYVAKAALAWSRARGRGDGAALLVFAAPADADEAAAAQALRRFIAAVAPELDRTLSVAAEDAR